MRRGSPAPEPDWLKGSLLAAVYGAPSGASYGALFGVGYLVNGVTGRDWASPFDAVVPTLGVAALVALVAGVVGAVVAVPVGFLTVALLRQTYELRATRAAPVLAALVWSGLATAVVLRTGAEGEALLYFGVAPLVCGLVGAWRYGAELER